MRRTKQILRGLAQIGRRAQSGPGSVRGATTNDWSMDDPLARAPRITVSPAVVADLLSLKAADGPVVFTDGEHELVVMVPIEQYREQLLALARYRAEEGNAQALSTARSAVLDPEELAALLSEWDHSRKPHPVGPPTADGVRAVRLSDPPQRRVRRNG